MWDSWGYISFWMNPFPHLNQKYNLIQKISRYHSRNPLLRFPMKTLTFHTFCIGIKLLPKFNVNVNARLVDKENYIQHCSFNRVLLSMEWIQGFSRLVYALNLWWYSRYPDSNIWKQAWPNCAKWVRKASLSRVSGSQLMNDRGFG
jgi:hypothetical protein